MKIQNTVYYNPWLSNTEKYLYPCEFIVNIG
jgi:hypothetical protein